ncbi:MAG: hypothetical protein JNK04_04430 [Myxococcales bacterium]|nr:hypothetical protein [Myxococcales bacterium]
MFGITERLPETPRQVSAEIRQRLARGLDFLATKRDDKPKRKHGNIPL